MKRMTIRQICFRTAVLAAAAGMLCGCAGTGHPASPSDELSVTVSGTGQTSETGTTILNTKDSTAVPVTNGSTAEETAPRQTETSGTTVPETDAPTGGNDTDKPDDTSADTSKGTSAETSEEKPPVPAKDGFNGICFAVPGAQSRGLDTDRLFDLVGAMNAGAFRNWMHATEILNGPTEVNKKDDICRFYLPVPAYRGRDSRLMGRHYRDILRYVQGLRSVGIRGKGKGKGTVPVLRRRR